MKRLSIILAVLTLVGCGTQHHLQNGDNQEINIGYGTTSKARNTRPVSHLTLDEKSLSGQADLASFLPGRIAGVQIGIDHATGKRAILIRGGSGSILGSNAALIIVDGSEMPDFDTANAAVNIHNIKSIDVLKEGSIYGSRGANGVVLITTK